jgi:hypothetical protein
LKDHTTILMPVHAFKLATFLRNYLGDLRTTCAFLRQVEKARRRLMMMDVLDIAGVLLCLHCKAIVTTTVTGSWHLSPKRDATTFRIRYKRLAGTQGDRGRLGQARLIRQREGCSRHSALSVLSSSSSSSLSSRACNTGNMLMLLLCCGWK